MSYGRSDQLKEVQDIIQEISKEIMWVNDREEEELMFDWGDKNIDQYIPRKQESYSVSTFFCRSSVKSSVWFSRFRITRCVSKSCLQNKSGISKIMVSNEWCEAHKL